MDTCPRARTLSARSETLDAWVLIAVTCKNWGCPICGRRKVAHYAQLVTAAKPNRLITLTVDPKFYKDPRDAFDRTRKCVPKLIASLRKAYGDFECFRVLETTKKGWPHYHLVVRSAYIPHAVVRSLWTALTGAIIVDVRQIKRATDIYYYVVKYLAKQTAVPWTKRRVTWTRNFFAAQDFTPGPGLLLQGEAFKGHTPVQIAQWEFTGCTLERHSRDCWIVHGYSPGADGNPLPTVPESHFPADETCGPDF